MIMKNFINHMSNIKNHTENLIKLRRIQKQTIQNLITKNQSILTTSQTNQNLF